MDYYEKNLKRMWPKDFFIGNDNGCEDKFKDDLFRLKNSVVQQIKQIIITQEQNKYIIGLQFIYKVQNSNELVFGNKVETKHCHMEEVKMVLEDEEYIISIFGRKGMNIDQIGFSTNKGKQIYLGGNGGQPFFVNAPLGYHFSIFGMQYTEYINCVQADIQAIPGFQQMQPKKYKEQYKQLSHQQIVTIMRLLVQYLDIRDYCKLFRICRVLSRSRHDFFVVGEIGKVAIYSCKPNYQRYFNKLLKHGQQYFSQDNQIVFNNLKQFIELTKNQIEIKTNQLHQNQNYEITKNGGDGVKLELINGKHPEYYFSTSYGWGEITFQRSFDQLFNKEIINKINQGKMALVFGAQFKSRGPECEAYLQVEIIDEKDEVINLIRKDIIIINHTFYLYYFIKYIHSSKLKKVAQKFKFCIAGKDKVFWAEFFGPRIAGITFKLLSLECETDYNYLKFLQEN